MVHKADHPVRGEPHDFIIFKREILRPRQVYDLNEFPNAVKDAKESGVTRNGRKVTRYFAVVRKTSRTFADRTRVRKVR